MPRQRRVIGDVVRIDLGDGTHAYARVLPGACFAFYDLLVREDVSPDQVAARAVLFIIPAMNHAVTRGRWLRVGNVPLEAGLREAPPMFIQDAIKRDQFFICHGAVRRPAARAECEGLERFAVWDPTQVEDRLRDHFAGRPNKWVESMKIRA